MASPKMGVLLINLGTPDSTKVGDVRKYLREFLMDGRVIDFPFLPRFALVQGIIAPFRAPKSAKEYRKLWTPEGSPLLLYSQQLAEEVQKTLGEKYKVVLGMRYQNPSIESGLEELRKAEVERIFVFPLFPQYASSTIGSAHAEVMRILSGWLRFPSVEMLDSYPAQPKMIETFAEIGRKYMAEKEYDHIIFTYHGLPERHLKKESKHCAFGDCCKQLTSENRLCYRAQCFETTRHIVKALGLTEDQYTVCFQSRLGRDPWIQPYTEDIIIDLAKKGKKNILAFTPSFVADCLETTVEVGEEYAEVFEENGGEHLQLAESLNVHPLWVEAVSDMIEERCASFVEA